MEASSSSPWPISTRRLRAVGSYTIFGKVIAGTDVVDAIAAVPVNDPASASRSTPVTIESITIIGAPLEASSSTAVRISAQAALLCKGN